MLAIRRQRYALSLVRRELTIIRRRGCMDQHPALLGTSSLSMRAAGRALPPLARCRAGNSAVFRPGGRGSRISAAFTAMSGELPDSDQRQTMLKIVVDSIQSRSISFAESNFTRTSMTFGASLGEARAAFLKKVEVAAGDPMPCWQLQHSPGRGIAAPRPPPDQFPRCSFAAESRALA